ncbi:13376_t:CDS:2 [Acaulospora morrowiae]|uniref:13376_t:CDS:1 n=1 Tax=Acaulospora morrowiae TaxID=94023 RepID=A0A9N8YR34_9GLOM|nr:13376_t:CDS:2 [Acaulospora morrowiae]
MQERKIEERIEMLKMNDELEKEQVRQVKAVLKHFNKNIIFAKIKDSYYWSQMYDRRYTYLCSKLRPISVVRNLTNWLEKQEITEDMFTLKTNNIIKKVEHRRNLKINPIQDLQNNNEIQE